MNDSLVRHVLFPLHERLKRKPTFRWLAELERTQWLSPEQIAEYQFTRLRRLVEFAYAHVPYYRAALDEHGVRPQRLQSPHDLRDFPFLTRELRLHRLPRHGARGYESDGHFRSGAPSSPALVRCRAWIAGNRSLWLTHRDHRQDRVRQIRDWCLNSRLLSVFDMGEKSLERHLAASYRHRPAKIYGYASSLYLLAGYMERQQALPPPKLRAVFATAEPLFDFQRTTIEAALDCPVGIEYGCRDGGLVALECAEGGLHILAEGMYAEIVDPDADGRGEIVLTNLESQAFPIIRYRTGDIGSLDPSPCHCGRGRCSTCRPSTSFERSPACAISGSCRNPSTASSFICRRSSPSGRPRRRHCAPSSPRSLAPICASRSCGRTRCRARPRASSATSNPVSPRPCSSGSWVRPSKERLP